MIHRTERVGPGLCDNVRGLVRLDQRSTERSAGPHWLGPEGQRELGFFSKCDEKSLAFYTGK